MRALLRRFYAPFSSDSARTFLRKACAAQQNTACDRCRTRACIYAEQRAEHHACLRVTLRWELLRAGDAVSLRALHAPADLGRVAVHGEPRANSRLLRQRSLESIIEH